MKLLLFLLLIPIISKCQDTTKFPDVYAPDKTNKVHKNPLMPIVCGTPVLISGKPDSFLLKIATDKDKIRYIKKVWIIWLDIYRKPVFYNKRGRILKLKLKG